MMPPPIYVGPGTPALCEKASAARAAAKADKTPLKRVAADLGITRGTLRKWADAHGAMREHAVQLVGFSTPPMDVCRVVTPQGALAAAVAAYREFPDTFKRLELPGWELRVDGQAFALVDVRKAATPRRAA